MTSQSWSFHLKSGEDGTNPIVCSGWLQRGWCERPPRGEGLIKGAGLLLLYSPCVIRTLPPMSWPWKCLGNVESTCSIFRVNHCYSYLLTKHANSDNPVGFSILDSPHPQPAPVLQAYVVHDWTSVLGALSLVTRPFWACLEMLGVPRGGLAPRASLGRRRRGCRGSHLEGHFCVPLVQLMPRVCFVDLSVSPHCWVLDGGGVRGLLYRGGWGPRL